MLTIEKTAPIGSDWPMYLELLAIDAEIQSLKTAGNFPLALALVQERRDRLKSMVQAEVDAQQGRYVDANNKRAWTLKTAAPIAEYERLIAEGTVQADRLEVQIAAMDAHDRWQADWKEIQELDKLRERIRAWRRAIEEHPTKQARYRPQPVPEFIKLP